MAFKKLDYINTLRFSKDDSIRIKLVELVYSLAMSGTSRKLSLEETLASLNLTSLPSEFEEGKSKEEGTTNGVFLDNPNVPSFFIYFRFSFRSGMVLFLFEYVYQLLPGL